MKRDVLVCADPAELATAASSILVEAARSAQAERGVFSLALAGGSTPLETYRGLSKHALDWARTQLFFGDERVVPPDDPASNFGSARRHLLDPAGVPASSVFPIPTEGASADACARTYEGTLRARLIEPPKIDLVLLGLGEDGHTASLFPGSLALETKTRWVVAAPPGRLPPDVERITLTLPVLNAARRVLFLVQGAAKAEVLREVLEPVPGRTTLPAARVQPVDGDVLWLVDRAAAEGLTERTSRRQWAG